MGLYDSALFDANQSIRLTESVEMIYHKINCLLFAKHYQQMNQFIDECIQRIDEKQMKETENLTKDWLKNMKELNTSSEESSQIEETTNLWVHPNVEIKSSESKGRYLLAKDYIPPNSLIIREKSSNNVYFGENIYQFCSNCDKRIGDQIYPCLKCNEVVFCDEKCAKRATNGVHRYECGITGHIFYLGSNALQVFRIFCEIGFSRVMSATTLPKQKDFDPIKYKEEVSQMTGNKRTRNQKISRFEFISNLVEHTDRHNPNIWIQNTITAIELTILLHYRRVLKKDIIYDIKSLASVANIISTYLSRLSTNAFGRYVDKSSDTHIANCLCLFSSLINHNCDPNTKWYFTEEYIEFQSKRHIEMGEEINASYGPDLTDSLIERNNKLREDYYFECNCLACLQSIRTIRSLKCLSCGGPVAYELQNSAKSCLECGQSYPKVDEMIEEVDDILQDINQLIERLTDDSYRSDALDSIEFYLKFIIKLVYKLSPDLLALIRQLIKVCLKFSDVKKAIDLSQYLLVSIDFQTNNCSMIFTDIFDDLFLLIRLYYTYLSSDQSKELSEWRTCFHIYETAIKLLQRIRTQRHGNQKKVFAINYCIESLKKELNYLKNLFNETNKSEEQIPIVCSTEMDFFWLSLTQDSDDSTDVCQSLDSKESKKSSDSCEETPSYDSTETMVSITSKGDSILSENINIV